MNYGLIFFFLIVFIASILLLWKIPIWQLGKKHSLRNNEYLNLENEFRKTIAQIIGGLFVLIGLYFTWKQVSATKDSIAISQETLITDKYSKAIDQLGSNNAQVRLGGIFALEKVASSSNEYVSVVNKVLATYIRQKSRSKDSSIYEEMQTVVDIISYKEHKKASAIDTSQIVNISNVLLRNIDFDNSILINANMNNSDFNESSFRNANLSNVSGYEANFSRTNLTKSILSKSTFYGSSFAQATMVNSELKNVNFQLVCFKEANLTDSDLTGSNLSEADLTGTILYGADLSNTRGLTKFQLNKARINRLTKLPSNLK